MPQYEYVCLRNTTAFRPGSLKPQSFSFFFKAVCLHFENLSFVSKKERRKFNLRTARVCLVSFPKQISPLTWKSGPVFHAVWWSVESIPVNDLQFCTGRALTSFARGGTVKRAQFNCELSCQATRHRPTLEAPGLLLADTE